MVRGLLLLLALLGIGAAAGPPPEGLPAAWEGFGDDGDDECLAEGGSTDCALHARQMRGQQVLKVAGSCKNYGCGAYTKGRDCQCTPDCGRYKNCCYDFTATCAGGGAGAGAGEKGLAFRPVPADCKSFGCGGAFMKGRSCQCNADCAKYGSCCADYAAACSGRGTRPGFMSMVPYARSGVNFGGLLVLEDWFFSGYSGSHVMSVAEGQGLCLPPLVENTGERWPSEGILVKRLQDSKGPDETVKILEAHRDTYITETDFAEAAEMGISKVRLPIPWYAFADALAPIDATAYAPGAKVVPDPYYSTEAAYVTVDRGRLVKLLRMAAAHNMKIIFDVHNMPGGAQDGTYNGIWPMKPMFWLGSSRVGKPVALTEAGLWVAEALIKWTEQLDPDDFAVVEGLTLMNEPGHMANIDKQKGEGFIESEQQVLDWVDKSSDMFRKSTLPLRGVKLYVNLVETTWADPYNMVPAWWDKAFSSEERHSWAVFDVHWYIAWSGDLCSGRTTSGGQFSCDMAVDELRPLLRNCAVHDMVRFFKKVNGLKACSEWSLGTFEQPRLACQNPALLHAFFEEQLDVYKMYEIEPFFWTWNIPYGNNFQSAWSLKYIAGLEESTPGGTCG